MNRLDVDATYRTQWLAVRGNCSIKFISMTVLSISPSSWLISKHIRSLLSSETLENDLGVLGETEVLGSRSVSGGRVGLLSCSGLQSWSGEAGDSLHLVLDN